MGAGQTNPIRELDGLRGLAALLVVLFHVPKWADFLHSNVVNNGYLMVDFFFVLSGFVISRAYGDRITTGRELVRFQFLRLGRVYPVHAVFLLLFVGIEAAGWRSAPVPGPASSDRLAAVVQHVFLVQAIGPTGNALTFNAPAWSISVELYAYLLFGLLALFTRTGRVAVLSLVALGSLAALAAGRGTGFEDWLRCLAGFSVGCLTSAAVGKARGRLPAWTPAAVLAAMALMLACRSSPAFHALTYVLAAALIAALVCGPEGRVHAALRHPALGALGEWSYSIYMSHYFVLWAVDAALGHMPGVTVESLPGGGRAVTLPTLAALAATGVSLLAVLGVSVLTHAWVEKPLRAWSRRVASPGRCG